MKIDNPDIWSCSKSCDNFQPTSVPCDGQCPNSKLRYPSHYLQFSDSHGYAMIGGECNKGSICHLNTLDEECYETKECEDVVIPENLRCLNTTIIYEETKTCEPYCEGNICISECYDYCDGYYCVDSCKETEDGWACFAKCNPYYEPCWGHCQEGAVLLAGKCVLASDTYKCGVQNQLLDDPCNGRCPMGRMEIQGKCILNTWDCEGKIQPTEEPCLRKCPETKLLKFIDYDFDTLTYLSDYVTCGEKCLLRSEAWECDGTCQPHSVPCQGKCLDVECSAEWKYANVDGECVIVKDDSGCAADAAFPIYSSSTAAVASLSLRNLATVTGREGQTCPRTHCVRGDKCCKLAWFGVNGGLQCPYYC